MLANSHQRPASRASRRGVGLLACFFLALLILLILSPRARAEHSAADTVAGLTASVTHTVATAAQGVPAPPSAPIAAPSASATPPAPVAVAGVRTVAAAAPSVAAAGGVAGAVHTTLDRTTGDVRAAAGHAVASTHLNTGPVSGVTGLTSRVTSAAGKAPAVVAGGVGTVVHTVVHATSEAPAAGVLLREVARSTGTVAGTVEHLAPKTTPIPRVALPARPSPVLAPPHARAALQPGELKQPRPSFAPTAAGQPPATALLTSTTPAGAALSTAQSQAEIVSSPAGASAASDALAALFAAALQPTSYALLTGYETTVPVPGTSGNAPAAPAPAHPAPAAPPGGLAPGVAGGSGGGLSTSTFLALAGLLMLAMPRALRRLRLLTEPGLPAPFALISARPG